MITLSPSLLSANFLNLQEDIEELNKLDVKYLHIDIMDGNFVPNISFGPGIVKHLRSVTNMVFDTHLMIEQPEKYIETFAEAGSDIITVHPESTKHIHRTIQLIKQTGKKAGLVLNPATDESILNYLIEDLDLVLVMSVNPGFGGQAFIPQMLEKISRIRQLIERRNPSCLLEVDGGIKIDNVSEVLEAGANVIVAGSGVFNKQGISNNVKSFRKIFEAYDK